MNSMDKPKEESEAPWTSQDWKNLAEAIGPLADKYLAFKKEEYEMRLNRLSAISRHNRRLTYSLVLFLTGLVVVMSYLTWLGSVSGEALLFLAGTITGYVVLMVQGLTFPLFESEPSEG